MVRATKDGDLVSGRSILKVLGLWALLSVIAGGTTAVLTHTLHAHQPNLQTLLTVAEVYALMPVAMLIVYGGWQRLKRLVRFQFTSWQDIGLAVGMYAATLAAVFLAYVLLSPLLGSAGDSARFLFQNATYISRLPHASVFELILIFVQTTFLAALIEEFFFRGLLFKWLRRRYSAVKTLLVISILFGLVHFIGPAIAIAGFLWGLGAGILREKTGSTLNTIVMHILGDCTLLVGAYIIFY
jgi:membrane protease YdiL (CAAX protease family)